MIGCRRLRAWRRARKREQIKERIRLELGILGAPRIEPWEEELYSVYLQRLAPIWPWTLPELISGWATWKAFLSPRLTLPSIVTFGDVLTVAAATNELPSTTAREIGAEKDPLATLRWRKVAG